MAYSQSPTPLWRGAAGYVDQLLRGTKVDELPIQQPTTFNFVINLATSGAASAIRDRESLGTLESCAVDSS
jgi:putative ABC transport system substrate-binding protein